MNLFVTKLSYSTTSEQLKELFENYGSVESAKVIWDKDQNRSKGFGFVEMENDSDANNAIDALDNSEFGGRTIIVKRANPRQ